MARNFDGLIQGLRELGYVEGQNLIIERRYAEGRADRWPELASELVINMKTAKAFGLTIPPSVLLRADQVIE